MNTEYYDGTVIQEQLASHIRDVEMKGMSSQEKKEHRGMFWHDSTDINNGNLKGVWRKHHEKRLKSSHPFSLLALQSLVVDRDRLRRWRKRSVPELQAVVVPEPLILSHLQYPVPELQAVVELFNP